MTDRQRHHTVHSRTVAADAATLYDLVADVTRWPVIFEPSLHVHHLERGRWDERFQLWALVNGDTATWTSRRTLDPDQRRISFEQERSSPPVAAMGGEWTFRPLADGTTEVLLEHSFAAVDDDPAALDRITTAVDHNSREELAALGRLAELDAPLDDVVFSFEDSLRIPGSAAAAYEFIDDADRWPDRLPHVSRVVLEEEPPGVQDLEMDTVTAAGHTHTTRSVRICFPRERIVYKQLVPPTLLFGHSGEWSFTGMPEGDTVVTARHTVAIDPSKVESVLGTGNTLADAGAYLREALGANSRATVTAAGEHARTATGTADGAGHG